MKIASWSYWSKCSTFLVIAALFLCSACKLFAPPPPPPPPEPQNQPPVIQAIIAEKEVNISTECEIVCKATDADGDTLKYWWSADGGMIRGVGDNVTWIAPDIGGIYTVKVMVSDGNGGEATDSIIFTVIGKPNQPPVITELTRDGKPITELTERVRVWVTSDIECIAEDPDGSELRYAWSTTGGKIQGEGAKVGWTAPGVAGNYKVIVVVADSEGAKAQASAEFNVACCGH